MKINYLTITLIELLVISLTLFIYSQSGNTKYQEQGSLFLGETRQRTLDSTASHIWQVKQKIGYFSRIEIIQKSIDVMVYLQTPDNDTLNIVNNSTKLEGIEKINWIANIEGDWIIEVKVSESSDLGFLKPGDYIIKWVVSHQASDQDKKIVTADSIIKVAMQFVDDNEYEKAISFIHNSIEMLKSCYGDRHPDVVDRMNYLGSIYFKNGMYAEAESLFVKVLEIREEILSPDNYGISEVLINLGLVYNTQGNYDKAEQSYKRAILIDEKVFGFNNPEVATDYNNLAELYLEQGRFEESETLFVKAINIMENALGKMHPNVAVSINNLAVLYLTMGSYEKVEPLYIRSLNILEHAYGQDDPNVGIILMNLGGLYYRLGQYNEAEFQLKRALAILSKVLGDYHSSIATVTNNLAALYDEQARYREAEPLYRQSLDILIKNFGEEHTRVASSFNNLGSLYEAQGNYTEARIKYERSLSIRKKIFGENHHAVATSYNNIAGLNRKEGKYAEAETLFKQALRIRETTFGQDNPEVAQSLNNLAVLYQAQGRYNEAESLFRQALEIRERSLGAEHPFVATTLTNLGNILKEQKRYEEAETTLEKALTIFKNVYGIEHPDVAECLEDLGELKLTEGKYVQAETLFQQSLAIRERVLGTEHPILAKTLNNLALLFSAQNDNSRALALVEKAANIPGLYSRNPILYANVYSTRAKLHKESNNTKQAVADLAIAIQSAETMRPQVGGGEETRAMFFQKYHIMFERMVAWQLEAGDVEKTIEYAERGRARGLLDQLAAGKIDIRQSIPQDRRRELETRETQALAQRAEFQQRITLLRSRKDLPDTTKLSLLDSLQMELQKADKAYQDVWNEILNESPLWRDLVTAGGKPEPLSNIRSELIPGQCLMLQYHIGEEESYLFLIPPPGQQAAYFPLTLDEESAKQLRVKSGPLTSGKLDTILIAAEVPDSSPGLMQMLAGRGVKPIEKTVSLATQTLHSLFRVLLPDTLWPRVQTCEEVILIPDGALYLLPFETLVVQPSAKAKEIRYWLDAGPPIRYAASATSLYQIEKRAKTRLIPVFNKTNVLSLSDPLYDAAAVRKTRQPEQRFAGTEKTTADSVESRGLASLPGQGEVLRSQYARVGGNLIPLPRTADESKVLTQLYDVKREPPELVVLQSLAATEENLRRYLPEKRYVHIATHGIVDKQRQMLFASLALTPPAADTTVSGNDGFLELHEIYQLKLPECELAVLSACETNVGRYIEGEGVFALTRGFLAAGARRVVASQWQVDDASTAEIIGEFFRQIAAAEKAGKPIDYTTALRDAKQKVRNQEKWADPFYWAPFVITGKH